MKCDGIATNPTTDTISAEWMFFEPIKIKPNLILTPTSIRMNNNRYSLLDDGVSESMHYLIFANNKLYQYIFEDTLVSKVLFDFNATHQDKAFEIDGRLLVGKNEYYQSFYHVNKKNKVFNFELLTLNPPEPSNIIYNLTLESEWGITSFKLNSYSGCYMCELYDKNYAPTNFPFK